MKKKIHTDGHGGSTGNSEQKVPRKKPVPYVYPQWMVDYWRERDRLIWKTADEGTKAAIKERYGKA